MLIGINLDYTGFIDFDQLRPELQTKLREDVQQFNKKIYIQIVRIVQGKLFIILQRDV